MKIQKSLWTLLFVIIMFLCGPGLTAQEIRVTLDESTYGITPEVLEGYAKNIIDSRLGDLKGRSGWILATVKATSEDYEKEILGYEMEVIFLDKVTYTAWVKSINFDVTTGELKNIRIKDQPLLRLEQITKGRITLSCKMKQGILIKPIGQIRLEKIPLAQPLAETESGLKLKSLEMAQSVEFLKRAELSLSKWWYAKGLATTPCDSIPTAVSGTKDVYKTFGLAFGSGNASIRLGNACTVPIVSGFLKYDSRLLAWNHIGHGWPGGIVLWDASLTAAIINALNPHRGLFCAVALINSCNTFNDPLKAAFIVNKPRTYIAGAISLPIGPSEKVDICFWKEVLLNKKRMDLALKECSKDQKLIGAFGLWGDGGFFY